MRRSLVVQQLRLQASSGGAQAPAYATGRSKPKLTDAETELHWSSASDQSRERTNLEVRKTGEAASVRGRKKQEGKIRASETPESAQAATLPLDI